MTEASLSIASSAAGNSSCPRKQYIFLVIVLTSSTFVALEYNSYTNLMQNLSTYSYERRPALLQPRLTGSVKRILYWTTRYGGLAVGETPLKCGAVQCELTTKRKYLSSSHALIFYGYHWDMQSQEVVVNGTKTFIPKDLPPVRYSDQYWVLHMQEPPSNYVPQMQGYNSLFNWTLGYRTDSDAFLPYGWFDKRKATKEDEVSREKLLPSSKFRLVAQINSNCRDVQSGRANLVKALQQHIPVDVYGKCGPFNCTENWGFSCKKTIGTQYKFYLSFENSLCQDYVTEKFFEAYLAGMVPVVYGGANYGNIAPRGSYIDVNSFPSAKHLADYLTYLSENDEEYLKYFEWKKSYEVRSGMDIIKAYCQICKKLHEYYPEGRKSVHRNIVDWLYNNEGKHSACSDRLKW